MSFNTLSFKHLLVAAALLPGIAFASPIANIQDRGVNVITAPLEKITPNIIEHGPLNDTALEHLKESLTRSVRPTTTPEPDRVRRQVTPSSTVQGSLTIATSDAFVSVDVGDINLVDTNPANCHSETFNGPIERLQVFAGSTRLRAMNITSSSGNTSSVLSVCLSISIPNLFTP